MGFFLFYVLRIRRKIVLENLTRAYHSEKSKQEIKALAYQNYTHYGKILVEIFLFRLKSHFKRYVTVENSHLVQRALHEGKGVLLYGAHIGNFELMMKCNFLLNMDLCMVVKKIKNKWVNGVFNALRNQRGLSFISSAHLYPEILGLLKKNRVVGFVMDQHKNMKGRSVYVEFFNRPAATTTGLSALALSSGAPVIFSYFYRKPDGSFGLRFEEPPPITQTGTYDFDLFYNTQLFTKKIEETIRQFPEQWFWAHRRWKGIVPPEQGIKPVFPFSVAAYQAYLG